MKLLAPAIVLCSLVITASANADQTCKARANQQKLAGEALLKFMGQCEFEALEACQDKNAKKPDADRLMQDCTVRVLGVGPEWCNPHTCRTNSDCTGGARCGVCWGGICGE